MINLAESLPKAVDTAFFMENGYWISSKIIDDERLEQLRKHMEKVHNGEYETGREPWRGYWKPEHGNGLRSHKWGLRKINDFEQDMRKQESEMDLPEGESFNPVPIIMKAGQVSFHHALTFHGSGPNTTDKPRRSLAIHLMTGTTRYKAGTKGDSHMNVELLNGKDGDLFVGQWFPVLYQRLSV